MAKTNVTKSKKLKLVGGGLTQPQILHIMQKTPPSHVYQRPAKGGGVWDYVTGVYVKKVLNYAFGWLVDFEVKQHGREDDLVWVLGRLTVTTEDGNRIIKEQFGRAEVKMKKGTTKPMDYGNDLKAAATDALKKCASELGVASDIYGKNEFQEIKLEGIEDLPEPKKGRTIDVGNVKKIAAKLKKEA